MSELQNRLLAEGFAQQLEADWQFRIFRETAGQAQAADARQIAGDGENVREIHLQGVVGFFPQFKCRGRGSRRDDGIDFLECFQKVPANQCADFLGAQIVGVMVSAAQDRGTKNDAAFDFGAEARPAAFTIHVDDIAAFDPQSVANAVKTRQVGAASAVATI